MQQATEARLSHAPGRGWAGPTRPLLCVAAVIAVVGAAMAFIGAATTGISGDEDVHVRRLNNYIDRGLYVKDNELRGARGSIPDNAYVYAPATTMLLHEANVVMGKENLSQVKRTRAAYTGRHLGIAALGVAGLIAAGAVAGLILGRWQWGVVAAASLAAVPMWTGHSMFNPKDVSVATGHIAVTLGLILLATVRGHRHERGLTWAGACVLAAGTVVMLGTRPGMWPSLLASLVLFIGVLAWTGALHRRNVSMVAGSLVVAYLGLLAIYPRIFSHPFTMLWMSALNSSGFAHRTLNTDRGYLFRHTVEEWPLLLLGFVVVGTVIGVLIAVNRLKLRSPGGIGLLLVGSQMLTLPLLAVLKGTPLYNGLRQVLFSVPAAAVLATIGMAAILTFVQRTSTKWIWVAVAGAALILPTAVQASLFPYQYTYINAASELAGVKGDNDYWDTSFRELLPKVSSDIKVTCPHWAEGGFVARDNIDCRTRSGGTFSPFWKASHRPAFDKPKHREFQTLLRGPEGVPGNCRTVSSVTRWRNLSETTISRLLECHPLTKAEQAEKSRTLHAEKAGKN